MASQSINLPLCKYRYILFVSYFGTKYQGSQRLLLRGSVGEEDTIQEAIEVAVQKALSNKECSLTGASRTDKGVHALMNSFTLPLMHYGTPTELIKVRINEHLSRNNHDIMVNEVLLVPASFHPRKSVSNREYIYRIAVRDKYKMDGLRPGFRFFDNVSLLPLAELHRVLAINTIDLDKAREAMDIIRGEHDFVNFAKSLTVRSTVRKVDIDLVPDRPMSVESDRVCPMKFYRFQLRSHSFLNQQVRRIVSAILAYASFDRLKLKDISRLVNNPKAQWPENIPPAEPHGLYLRKITFNKECFDGAIRIHEDQSEEPVMSEMYCDNGDDVDVSDDHNKRVDIEEVERHGKEDG